MVKTFLQYETFLLEATFVVFKQHSWRASYTVDAAFVLSRQLEHDLAMTLDGTYDPVRLIESAYRKWLDLFNHFNVIKSSPY
jgi:hypothetical protein